ncbi:septum formation family protein [Leifsonia sp. H3M29-4]|uniref:septum formation family protein n=1 Tax=Salinibacterium metalliresistens TaxID=3031321 RepID=UPI0023D9DA73|nr:septum formation family protein [Salinibacterium metalliresistens]MDF1478447.1 septum formation family protein [Salinibacterium metalliresistens]
MHRTTRGIAAVVVVCFGVGIALGGCSSIKDVIDVATPIAEALNDQSTWIEVGDCFNEPGGDVVTDIPTVPCTEPHDYEVYAEFDIDRATFPGDDEVFSLADEGCYGPFAGYVGLAFEESSLDYNYYVPTADGWKEYNDRQVSCILFDPAGQISTSLAGAAR